MKRAKRAATIGSSRRSPVARAGTTTTTTIPSSASVQHRWWEIDLNFYIIKSLEWLGLATDVVPFKDQRRRGRQLEKLLHGPDDTDGDGAQERLAA